MAVGLRVSEFGAHQECANGSIFNEIQIAVVALANSLGLEILILDFVKWDQKNSLGIKGLA